MANERFIIFTLNFPENRIKDIQVLQLSDVFHLRLTLAQEETCYPFHDGKVLVKDYKRCTYNHLH